MPATAGHSHWLRPFSHPFATEVSVYTHALNRGIVEFSVPLIDSRHSR